LPRRFKRKEKFMATATAAIAGIRLSWGEQVRLAIDQAAPIKLWESGIKEQQNERPLCHVDLRRFDGS
jgi:hypothetical protein